MNKARSPICPVCGSAGTRFVHKIERYGFSVWGCTRCSSQFQNPQPKNADRYYDEGYYTGASAFNYQDERTKEYYHNFVHQARLHSIRKFLGDHSANGSRLKILDVGCAFGAFVRAAAEHGDAYGLDVSAYAVKEGNAINKSVATAAQLFCGDLTHLPATPAARKVFKTGSFSAITLIEVAEHLKNPRHDLAVAYRLLKPGGVLVIQTANFSGWQAVDAGVAYHYYLPGHLVYYTAEGLKEMLSQIGFTAFSEFTPTDFPLTAKWRKAWGDVRSLRDLRRYWNMSVYHLKSKLSWRGRPLTSSYVLYARK